MRDEDRTRAELAAREAALRARLSELEAALAETQSREARHRALLENVNVGVFVSSLSGRIIDANQRAAEIWGFANAEEYIRTPARELYADPDDRRQILAALERDGGVHNFEFRALRRDGSTTWVSTNAVLRPLTSGGEVFLIGMFQEVNERRAIEQRLRSSEGRFRVIAEQSLLGIAILQDNRIRYVNQAVSDLNEYSVEEMHTWTAIDFSRLIHPDDLGFAVEQARKKQSGDPSALSQYEYRLLTKSGHVRWAQQYSRSIEYEGRPANFVTIIDITARKGAELMLADEKERLSVTLRSIGDGVITTDNLGRVETMNHAAEEMTGATQAEASGRTLAAVFRPLRQHGGEPEEDLAARVRGGGARVEPSAVSELRHRDGSVRLVSTSAAPIRHADGVSVGVVIVFRDVSEEHKLHDSLQRAAKLESLGVLAAGIAHDFNNLLGGLYGHIDLARESQPTEARAHLDLARQAFDRAKALTGQLLAFAKGGAPVRQVGAVDEVIKECVAFALSGSNVSPHFDVDPFLWYAEFDKHQISQAIDNLVINAHQAMPSGGRLHVTARNIELGEDAYAELGAGRYVKISIRDEGVGMARDQLTKIFDPFFTTKREGSGLGLTTTYAILKKHDGTVEVESELGKGSTFHLLLPAADRTDLARPATRSRQHRGEGLALVMDDEPAVRRVFASMLARFGYEVVVSGEGSDALSKLREIVLSGAPVRFAMLDLTVRAGLGGKDIIGRIRELLPTLPVVASSGYSDDPVMARPHDFGFSASLQKPFLADELSQLLNGLCGER